MAIAFIYGHHPFLAFLLLWFISVFKVIKHVSISCSAPPAGIGLTCMPDSDGVLRTKTHHHMVLIAKCQTLIVDRFSDNYLRTIGFFPTVDARHPGDSLLNAQ